MKLLRDLYCKRLSHVMATREREDLSGSAVVFAPHPDDETLGCGGTIIRKRAAGAPVRLVFITDGSSSHRKFISAKELGEIRQREALAAAAALEVPPENVTFLGFEDGRIQENSEGVRDRLRDILIAHKPAEIYVTHPKEPHTDHSALYWSAIAAVKTLSKVPAPLPTIYAYPVWYWRHWPWTALASSSKKETVRIVQASLERRLGTSAFSEFQQSVFIENVLPQKRAALNCHVSQMQRFKNNPSWPILSDVSDGDFLNCFFQPYEMFYRPAICC